MMLIKLFLSILVNLILGDSGNQTDNRTERNNFPETLILDEISQGNCILVKYDSFFDEQSIKGFGVDFKEKNGAKRFIDMEGPTMFILPAQSQIPYILYPGDTISIFTSEMGGVRQPSLRHKSSRTRSTELKFFENITYQLGPCYGMKSYYLAKTINSYPEAVKYIQEKARARKCFLDSLYKTGSVRKEFYEIADRYITAKQIDELFGSLFKPQIYQSLNEEEIYQLSDSLFNALLLLTPSKSNYPWYSSIKFYVELLYDHLAGNFSDILGRLSKLPESKEKDFAFFYFFKKEMAVNSSIASSQIFELRKYCKDSLFVNYIESNVKIVKKPLVASSADNISNQSGEVSTIETIISRMKGNIVVLDFWASWCQPCLEEVPFTKELSRSLADSNVIFIMLSSDTYKLRWESAIKKHRLGAVGEQYIIQDFDNNSFVKKFKVTSIPRYMIFGPNGELKSADAPRPSERAFPEIISSLIKSEFLNK